MAAADQGLHDELLQMFTDDQRTWGAVLELAGRDQTFSAQFQQVFDERGGWDMAAIAEWPEPPPVVAGYQRVHRKNCARLREIVDVTG